LRAAARAQNNHLQSRFLVGSHVLTGSEQRERGEEGEEEEKEEKESRERL
jgi:hypothetical protein